MIATPTLRPYHPLMGRGKRRRDGRGTPRSRRVLAPVAGLAVAAAAGWWWRPSWARVAGDSMAPLLPDGAWIVVARSRPRTRRALPPLGAVVVAEHPQRPGMELVKRVAAVDAHHGLIWLSGDNGAASTDSGTFGPIPAGGALGRVRLRLRPWPPRRIPADPGRL